MQKNHKMLRAKTNKLFDQAGKEIEEKVDGALVKMINQYQGLIIAVLGSFMVFVFSQTYNKLGLILADNAAFNIYMHRNEDQIQLLKSQIMELKQMNKEQLRDIRVLEQKQNLHEKESAQRWSGFLRGEENGER
jgi:hypothetical protein